MKEMNMKQGLKHQRPIGHQRIILMTVGTPCVLWYQYTTEYYLL